jgi:hypothetical protein
VCGAASKAREVVVFSDARPASQGFHNDVGSANSIVISKLEPALPTWRMNGRVIASKRLNPIDSVSELCRERD